MYLHPRNSYTVRSNFSKFTFIDGGDMTFELKEYKKACESGACKQPYDNIFLGLWRATNGDICETGCPYFNNGRCRGYLELKGTKIINSAKPKPPEFTNADLAKKFGVSKRQVSKMRRNGNLNKTYS